LQYSTGGRGRGSTGHSCPDIGGHQAACQGRRARRPGVCARTFSLLSGACARTFSRVGCLCPTPRWGVYGGAYVRSPAHRRARHTPGRGARVGVPALGWGCPGTQFAVGSLYGRACPRHWGVSGGGARAEGSTGDLEPGCRGTRVAFLMGVGARRRPRPRDPAARRPPGHEPKATLRRGDTDGHHRTTEETASDDAGHQPRESGEDARGPQRSRARTEEAERDTTRRSDRQGPQGGTGTRTPRGATGEPPQQPPAAPAPPGD